MPLQHIVGTCLELSGFSGLREQGDKVALSLTNPETGEVHLRPIRSVAEATFGSVTTKQRPEDLDTLRRAFERQAGREVPSEPR